MTDELTSEEYLTEVKKKNISSQGVYPLRGWLDTVMLLYLGRIKVFPLLAAKLLANLMLWFFKYAIVRTKMQKRLMCFELTVILTVEE